LTRGGHLLFFSSIPSSSNAPTLSLRTPPWNLNHLAAVQRHRSVPPPATVPTAPILSRPGADFFHHDHHFPCSSRVLPFHPWNCHGRRYSSVRPCRRSAFVVHLARLLLNVASTLRGDSLVQRPLSRQGSSPQSRERSQRSRHNSLHRVIAQDGRVLR
jgi:hypothetical protein